MAVGSLDARNRACGPQADLPLNCRGGARNFPPAEELGGRGMVIRNTRVGLAVRLSHEQSVIRSTSPGPLTLLPNRSTFGSGHGRIGPIFGNRLAVVGAGAGDGACRSANFRIHCG